jgi:hypothetical protein
MHFNGDIRVNFSNSACIAFSNAKAIATDLRMLRLINALFKATVIAIEMLNTIKNNSDVYVIHNPGGAASHEAPNHYRTHGTQIL